MSKMSEQFNELKDKGGKEGKGWLNLNPKQAKLVTWAAYLVLFFVLLSVISGNVFDGHQGDQESTSSLIPKEPQMMQKTETDISLVEQEIEQRLEKILGQIRGAGTVNVSVALSSGPTYEYAVNTMANSKQTEEQVNGGTRIVSENMEEGKLVIARENSQDSPVIIRKSKPEIQGVLVVAEGASNAAVKLELSRAVETVMGISSHQVHVVARER